MGNKQRGKPHSSREVNIRTRLEALERIRLHKEEMLKERGGQYIDFNTIEAINESRGEQDERNQSIFTESVS